MVDLVMNVLYINCPYGDTTRKGNAPNTPKLFLKQIFYHMNLSHSHDYMYIE